MQMHEQVVAPGSDVVEILEDVQHNYSHAHAHDPDPEPQPEPLTVTAVAQMSIGLELALESESITSSINSTGAPETNEEHEQAVQN